jgi:hypothetical protein
VVSGLLAIGRKREFSRVRIMQANMGIVVLSEESVVRQKESFLIEKDAVS